MAQIKNILLVDDDEDLREALAEQLVMTEDFEVFEAENGSSAMARTKEVHVVIVVVTILAAVKISGGAWAASECGTEDTRPCSEDDPVQRDPGGQMAGGFVLVVVGYLVGGLYEAFEPGLSHKHAIGP